MADITLPLPADLPENWTMGQTVAPTGADAGLSEQHGYNYLNQQVNNAQKGVNLLEETKQKALTGTAGQVVGFDGDGKAAAQAVPSHKHSAADITSGTLPVSRGGTGATTAAAARTALGAASQEELTEMGNNKGAYGSDFYLYITGKHPCLSANPYNDYFKLRYLLYVKPYLERTLELTGEAQAITIYDGGSL